MTPHDQLWSKLDATLGCLQPPIGLYAQTGVGNVRAWVCPPHAVAYAGQIVVAIQLEDGSWGFRQGQLVHSLSDQQVKALLDAEWFDHPHWLRDCEQGQDC